MAIKCFFANFNNNISIFRNGSCFFKFIIFVFFKKQAGLFVVVDNAFQKIYSKIVASHEALQKLIDQRPKDVASISGLRYFTLFDKKVNP